MKLVLSLVILCLAGGSSAKSVQDLKSELLQAIREMIEDPPQGKDITIDPMPPYTEQEEEDAPGEDNTKEPMPPFPEEGEAGTPGEDNTVDPMSPFSEEKEAGKPGEENTVDSMPPFSEEEEYAPGEDDTKEPMSPFSEEEEAGTPGEDNTVDSMPPFSEEEEYAPGEDDTKEPMPPFLEEEEAVTPGEDDNTIGPMPPYTEEEGDAPGEDNTVDPMSPFSEEEEEEAGTPGEDNTVDPMSPFSEEKEAGKPGEDNTLDSMPPFSEKGGDAPDENVELGPLPASPNGEESDAAEDMGPSLTDEEEARDSPAAKEKVQDLESELLQAIRQMIEDPPQGDNNTIDPMPPYPEEQEQEGNMDIPPEEQGEGTPPAAKETLQAGREVKSNKARALDAADTFHVHSVAEDASGRCVCTVMAPSPNVCSEDNNYHYIKELEEQVTSLTASIQILVNRTAAATDILVTMLQIQHLTDRLDVLQADREQLLTDQFTSIRDEIIALAALLPQLEQDREDAELLQLYQNQLDNLTSILAQLEGQHGVSVHDLQEQVLQLTQQLQACQQGGDSETQGGGFEPQGGFEQQQTVQGRTVTCANTNIEQISGFTAYTCHDIKVNGQRFPNGVACDLDWDERDSRYTDHQWFCNKVLEPTGQLTTKIQVVYRCEGYQNRAVWQNGFWAADKSDNGYTLSLRCLV